jgi:hypothetical protein
MRGGVRHTFRRSVLAPFRRSAFPAFRLCIIASFCTACTVTPLTNRIAVGEEPFVVGVGEGEDGMTDLYAALAHGGAFVRLTFNRMVESAPRLAASGRLVAYLRRSAAGSGAADVVVLDLGNGAERRVALPHEAGAPAAVAWLEGDARIAVRTDSGLYGFAAPSAAAVPTRLRGADSATADSALGVPLGDPVAAMAVPCGSGDLCVRTADTALAPLEAGARGAVRWGADSVGYFTAAGFEVRPLAGGHSRHPAWTGAPSRLRELTYSPPPAGAAR